MFDQSFTAENFRKIFDYENRKGIYLEGKFFPEVEKITFELKKCSKEIKSLRKQESSLSPEDYETKKKALNKTKKELKNQKNTLLTEELEKISATITSDHFRIALHAVSTPSGKTAYAANNDPQSYFAVKQIQYNIHKLYKVKQSNRYEIICQLRGVLRDGFPKYVIRTDIEDFYESIPQEKLITKFEEEQLLTFSSKKIIRQILGDYKRLSGGSKGIPRGIGVSAYFAELYMRDFDHAIKSHKEVIFYSRYVDDIIVIFSPNADSSTTGFLSFIEKQAASLGLALNSSKTQHYDVTAPQKHTLDYLGYNISFGDGSIKLALSDKRKTKYKNRIKHSFQAYKKGATRDERKARKILVKRLRFLSSNTRLHNNKRNILVGIFYSNRLLTDTQDLKFLDDCLETQISTLTSTSLKTQLSKMSFREGFERRQYVNFKVRDIADIVRLWKHEA